MGLKSSEKNFRTPFNPAFLKLFIVKSFETLPKHSALSFISEFFALNCYTFVVLSNKKLLLLLQCKLKSFS